MTREELISECKRQSESGEDVEAVVRYLRASGCSKIDSIAILRGACGIGLAKAKEVVHFSPTWDDTRASDEKFQDDIVDALTNEKIDGLVRGHLRELGRDPSGWDALYCDPADGRLWELIYPHSNMHGGGPPQLRVLTADEARQKYGDVVVTK